jgi:hypothetical protein
MVPGLLDPGSRIRWRDPDTGLFRWGRIVDATATTIDVDVVESGREPIRIRKNLVHGFAYGFPGPFRRYQIPPDNVRSLKPFEHAVQDGEEVPMAEKKKAAKKARGPKAAAPKDTGPKPNRTFAVRITTEELDAIHKAAGPRGATRYARQLLAAFAAGSVDQFKGVLEEAAANQKA